MKKQILLTALIFAVSGMYAGDKTVPEGKADNPKLTVCDFSKVSKNETISLSSLVQNCTLVQLEDVDEALFKQWFTTVTDKYIGVRQQGKGAYKLFDRSGKFLCDVGKVGNGPGEYSFTLYDDVIDDKSGLIYFSPFSGDKIMVFNTSGKFVKSIVAPQKLHKPKLFLSDNGVLTVLHMAFDGEKAIAIQFDSNGKVIKTLAPPSNLVVGSYDGELFNTRNTSAFDFLHTSSDTLYHYNVKENKIEPVYTIAVSGSEKPFRQYFELNDRYLTNVFGKNVVVSTNKKTKESSFVKVVNDYYGNMQMPVSIVNFRNGYFVLNIEPGSLKDKIEARMKESNCTAKDKEALKKILSSLNEEANNMLFVGKLK